MSKRVMKPKYKSVGITLGELREFTKDMEDITAIRISQWEDVPEQVNALVQEGGMIELTTWKDPNYDDRGIITRSWQRSD